MDYLVSTPAQLGLILKSARKKKHITQAAAGKQVGLKQGTVSVVENSAERTTVETLYKLLSALNLELVIRDKNSDMPTNDLAATKREW